jgi:stage 0 sporulation protein B (sporulation initiation phosphotransferase)
LNRVPYIPFIISIVLNVVILIQPWGALGSSICSVLSVIFLVAGLLRIQKSKVTQNELEKQEVIISPDYSILEKEQEKFLQSLRHLRHDWLNHFQVLLGYLKLQRYDVCEEYIKKVTENTNNDSRIAQLGYQPLVAFLLTFNALHKELLLELELPKSVDLKQYADEVNHQIFMLIKGLVEIYLRYALTEDGQPNTLVLMVQPLDTTLYISAEFEGELAEEAALQEIYALVKKFGNEEGFFVEGLHNNKESIMEFYVPLSVKAEVDE